jgi:hypothetical protein
MCYICVNCEDGSVWQSSKDLCSALCHLLLQQQIDRERERSMECYILHVVRDFLVWFFAEHGIVFFIHHVVLLGLSFFSESELYLISVLNGFFEGFLLLLFNGFLCSLSLSL